MKRNMSGTANAAGTPRRISVIRWTGKERLSANNEPPTTLTISNIKERSSSGTMSTPRSVASDNESKNENKYTCTFCGKSFKWHSHWKSHERTHTGERPFKCEICGKAFTRSDGLQCHKILHVTAIDPCVLYEGENWYTRDTALVSIMEQKTVQSSLLQCHICSRKCYSFAGLMKHIQKHKGGVRLKCEVCGKMFAKKSALEIHSRVHTGIKPYPCNFCTKAFSIHGNLKRHLLIHTGERPYKCIQCSNSFNNASHLKRHQTNKTCGS